MLSGYPGYGSGFMQPGAGQPYGVSGMYGGSGYYGQDGMPIYPNSGYVQSEYSPTYPHNQYADNQQAHNQYADYYGAPTQHTVDNIVREVVHEPSKKSYNPNAEPPRSALKTSSPMPSPRKDTRTPSPPLNRNEEKTTVPVLAAVPIPVSAQQQPHPEPQPQHAQHHPQSKQTAEIVNKPVMVDAATGITVDSGTSTDDFDDIQVSVPIVPNKQQPVPSNTSAPVKPQRQVPFPEWKPEYSTNNTKGRVPPPMPPAPTPQQAARNAAPPQPPAVAVDARNQPAQWSRSDAVPAQRSEQTPPAPADTRVSSERVTSRMDLHKSNPLRNTCPLPSMVVDTLSAEEEESDECDNADVLGQLRQELKLSTADFNRAVAARMHKKLIEQHDHHKHSHQQQPSPAKHNAKHGNSNTERRSFMV